MKNLDFGWQINELCFIAVRLNCEKNHENV